MASACSSAYSILEYSGLTLGYSHFSWWEGDEIQISSKATDITRLMSRTVLHGEMYYAAT